MLRCSWLVEVMFYRCHKILIILIFKFFFWILICIYCFWSQASFCWLLETSYVLDSGTREHKNKHLVSNTHIFLSIESIPPKQSFSLPFSPTISQCQQILSIFRAKLRPIHKDILMVFFHLYFKSENLIQYPTVLYCFLGGTFFLLLACSLSMRKSCISFSPSLQK